MALLRVVRAALVLSLALLAALAAPALAVAPPEAPACAVLPADNVWRADVSALPVHPRSAAWLASMGGASRLLHPDFGAYPYGYQVQFVDRATPRRSVDFLYASESDPGPYPLTSSTPIEPGGDRHAFMIDRDSCVLYELFDVRWDGARATAGSGAVFDLRSNALRPAGWTSADAAGLPIYPGLVRYDEIERGVIDHAIRFTAPRTDRSFVWPARHQAGAASDPSLPPMGARFRLRADFELGRYSRDAQVILRAMQRHGMILADNGSSWFFQGVTDGRWPDALIAELKTIPAGAFDAVDASPLMVSPDTGAVRGGGVALAAGWHSRWDSQSAYLRMTPGQVADFWSRFRNTGTEAWDRGVWGRQVNLGLDRDDKRPYRLGMAVNWLWDDRIATTVQPRVAPGEIGEFRFSVRAPAGRGTYRLDLRPVADGTVWLEDEGVFWLIVVE